MRNKLIELYKQMSELTLPKCKGCRVPLSCCSSEYCLMAKDYAKTVWKEDIKEIPGAKIPFLNPVTGCIVPPHLRPNCTLHTCSINSLGFDKDKEWTDKYFALRNQIDEIEYNLYEESMST